MIDKSSSTQCPYKMVSVQRAEPPDDAEGSSWFGYVITQGNNVIHGRRQGNLEAVTGAVEDIVARLNERRLGKRGRVHLVMTPKKKPRS